MVPVTIHDYEDLLPQPGCVVDVELKLHQRAMVTAMNRLEWSDFVRTGADQWLRTSVGVCADVVGSGKSLCLLSLVGLFPRARQRAPYDVTYDYDGLVTLKRRSACDAEVVSCNVIVVPHSIQRQWRSYLGRHYTGPYQVVAAQKDVPQGGAPLLDFLRSNEVVVVTSTMAYFFFPAVAVLRSATGAPVSLSRLFVDEADSIRIHASICRPLAVFYWLVTSSAEDLLLEHGRRSCHGSTFLRELVAPLRANPQLNKYFLLKNADSVVQDSFRLEQPEWREVVCALPSSVRVLEGVVSEGILQMIHSGNVQGAVYRVCAGQASSEEGLVTAVTAKLQKKLVNLQVELEASRKRVYSSEELKAQHLKKVDADLAEARRKIDLIAQRVRDMQCKICLSEEVLHKTVTNCCQATFCFDCLVKWFCQGVRRSCPNCRHEMVDMRDTTVLCEPKTLLRDKLATVVEIVTKGEPGSKYLIFAEYDQSLSSIAERLSSLGVGCELIKGSGTYIDGLVSRFRHSNSGLDVLFLNSKYFGSGLNLESATDIILYHRMSSDTRMQAVGRAQRFGRASRLRVWQLLHERE